MEYIEKNGEVLITDIGDFDLYKIFECGQCFRWNQEPDGSYVGIAKGVPARLKMDGNNVKITSNLENFEKLWYDYFDLGKDYEEIRNIVAVDDYMKRASEFGKGIRILKQDRWEATCSFIISQCNNIPRIKKIIETLCTNFGNEVEFENRKLYTFPSAEVVSQLSLDDLACLKCGYRAPYILNAAKEISEKKLDLDVLAGSSYEDAMKALLGVKGIGKKVANCIVLFGLQMEDAFPIDVWMKRAISEHYGDGFDPQIFGGHAGIAQQYMFFYARSGEN